MINIGSILNFFTPSMASSTSFDTRGFRDYLYNRGLAYHYQAMELISMCRRFTIDVRSVNQYNDLLR